MRFIFLLFLCSISGQVVNGQASQNWHWKDYATDSVHGISLNKAYKLNERIILKVGNKKIEGINHHVLFFDEPFGPHAQSIYDTKEWPENPLFYVNASSKSDPDLAPEGHETMVLLIPVAAGIDDTEEIFIFFLCVHPIFNRTQIIA